MMISMRHPTGFRRGLLVGRPFPFGRFPLPFTMPRRLCFYLVALSAFLCNCSPAGDKPSLLPPGWDPVLAGDVVMRRLVNTSAPQVKGAHDA